jgi:hypothetical protein
MLPTIISKEIQGFWPQEQSWMHLDWISLSGSHSYISEFHEQYNARFNRPGLKWREGAGCLSFSQSMKFPERGISLLWSDMNAPRNKGWGLIQLSGKFFESHGRRGFQWLMEWCASRQLKATRIDIANNLFHKSEIISPLQKGLESGSLVVAGGCGWSSVVSRKGHHHPIGRTLYLGSRSSPTFSRVYDARIMHAPEVQFPKDWNWTRYEMELKGDYAQLLFSQLIGSVPGSGLSSSRPGEILKSFSDGFFARHEVQVFSSGSRSSRRIPCSQWSLLSRYRYKFRQRAIRPQTSRESSIRWLQFGGGIKLILAIEMALGPEALDILKREFWEQKIQDDWLIFEKIKALALEIQRPPLLIGGSVCQNPAF